MHHWSRTLGGLELELRQVRLAEVYEPAICTGRWYVSAAILAIRTLLSMWNIGSFTVRHCFVRSSRVPGCLDDFRRSGMELSISSRFDVSDPKLSCCCLWWIGQASFTSQKSKDSRCADGLRSVDLSCLLTCERGWWQYIFKVRSI